MPLFLLKRRRRRKPGIKLDRRTIRKYIDTAMKNKVLLLIEYTHKDGTPTKRRAIEPYSYRIGRNKYHMLYGYDVVQQGIRAFYLKGIKSIIVSNVLFEPKWKVEI